MLTIDIALGAVVQVHAKINNTPNECNTIMKLLMQFISLLIRLKTIYYWYTLFSIHHATQTMSIMPICRSIEGRIYRVIYCRECGGG